MLNNHASYDAQGLNIKRIDEFTAAITEDKVFPTGVYIVAQAAGNMVVEINENPAGQTKTYTMTAGATIEGAAGLPVVVRKVLHTGTTVTSWEAHYS